VAQVGLDFNFSPKLVLHPSLQELALLQNLSKCTRTATPVAVSCRRVQTEAPPGIRTFSATMNFVRRSLAR
jgi:hypothetical protein